MNECPINQADKPFRFDLGDPAVRVGAHAWYEKVRSEGGIARVVLTIGKAADAAAESIGASLGAEVYLLTRYSDVHAMLTDRRFVVNPRSALGADQPAETGAAPEELRVLTDNLLTYDGPQHHRIRRLVQPSFARRNVEGLEPRITTIANALVDRVMQAAGGDGEAQERFELIEDFAYPLPLAVITDLIGVPNTDTAMVRDWAEGILAVDYGEPLKNFIAYLKELFVRRRARPEEDLVSQLLHAEDGGDRLTDDELLSLVVLILVAGHATTVNLIGNSVFALLSHPEQRARVSEDTSLIEAAVEEVLRLWAPVEMGVTRYALETVEIGGTVIPQGSPVIPVIGAAGRDPNLFGCPTEFDILRENASNHLAFARGPHLCLGAWLARLEGKVAMTTLLTRMPNLRFDGIADEPVLMPTLFRGIPRMPLRF